MTFHLISIDSVLKMHDMDRGMHDMNRGPHGHFPFPLTSLVVLVFVCYFDRSFVAMAQILDSLNLSNLFIYYPNSKRLQFGIWLEYLSVVELFTRYMSFEYLCLLLLIGTPDIFFD